MSGKSQVSAAVKTASHSSGFTGERKQLLLIEVFIKEFIRSVFSFEKGVRTRYSFFFFFFFSGQKG